MNDITQQSNQNKSPIFLDNDSPHSVSCHALSSCGPNDFAVSRAMCKAGRWFSVFLCFVMFAFCRESNGQDVSLSTEQAVQFAKLALDGIDREFPNKTSHVTISATDNKTPKEMHPAFYGCFDWHSSVHGHWLLVRLLKSHPEHGLSMESRNALDQHLTASNIAVEVAYFNEKNNAPFERMYGWAWLLRLVTELHGWRDPQGQVWRENLRPLEERIVELTKSYLPRLDWPIRTGVHPDTAFALSHLIDYARAVGNSDLEALVVERGRKYYLSDTSYNPRFEPSGEDFFSLALNEADFMRRILPRAEYSEWLHRFLPTFSEGSIERLSEPVDVSDVTDGKLVHLAGLNFARAWCWKGIANALDASDPRADSARRAAQVHIENGLKYVFSGHYEGEHWLGTFALYAISVQ